MNEVEKNIRKESVELAEGINWLGNDQKLNGFGKELAELYMSGKIDEVEWNERLESYLKKTYSPEKGE